MASISKVDLSVFEAKFRIPPTPKSMVVRPRLVALLDDASECKLTVVTAPAGYGKTTLVASWLRARCATEGGMTDLAGERRACAWLALDERDNDLSVFVDHLTAAIQNALPNIRFDAAGLIQLPAYPSIHDIARFLIAGLGDLDANLTLALDDYHLIHETKAHALIEMLLAYSPDRFSIIVIARHDTPLPVARLTLQGKARQLRPGDLRFRPDEAAAFFEAALPVKLPPEVLAAVTEQADGWIAQLRLAAVLMQQAPDRVAPETIRHQAIDYLMEELLVNEPPPVRAFLLATSILERFSAPLANALLCPSCDGEQREAGLLLGWKAQDVPLIFRRVAQSGLFVSEVNPGHGWCRYHELFRDLLYQRLMWEYPADVLTLRGRAFEWLKREGHVEEALAQAQALGDRDGMADVVELHVLDAVQRYRWQTAQKWVEMLAPDTVRRRPALLLAQGYFLSNAGAVERLRKVLQWAEETLADAKWAADPAQLTLWRGTLALLRANYAHLTNRLDDSRAAAEAAMELLPRERLFERCLAAVRLSACMFHGGRFDEGRATLQAQLRDEVDERSPTAFRLRTALASSYARQADFRRARRELEMVEQIFGESEPYNEASRHFVLGRIAYEWNELDRAAEHFGAAARSHGGNYMRALEGLLGLALVAEARRDAQAAGNFAEQALLMAKAIGSENLITLALSFRTRLYLMRGQPAPDLISQPSSVRDDALILWTPIELPRVTEAWRLLRSGRAEDVKTAQRMIEETVDFMAAQHLNVGLAPALAVLALIHRARDQRGRALTALGQAVEIAARGGLMRSLLDFGPEMIGLLYELKLPGPAGDHVAALLAAATTTPVTVAPIKRKAALIEPLTTRELAVLDLVAANLSDKEIAAALCISPLTVRKHTTNIFAKLQVRNRREAATRSLELGLITPKRPVAS